MRKTREIDVRTGERKPQSSPEDVEIIDKVTRNNLILQLKT